MGTNRDARARTPGSPADGAASSPRTDDEPVTPTGDASRRHQSRVRDDPALSGGRPGTDWPLGLDTGIGPTGPRHHSSCLRPPIGVRRRSCPATGLRRSGRSSMCSLSPRSWRAHHAPRAFLFWRLASCAVRMQRCCASRTCDALRRGYGSVRNNDFILLSSLHSSRDATHRRVVPSPRRSNESSPDALPECARNRYSQR